MKVVAINQYIEVNSSQVSQDLSQEEKQDIKILDIQIFWYSNTFKQV